MPYKKDYVTDEEKAMLPALLAEAKSRGLLPNIHQSITQNRAKKTKPFPKDKNGYYWKVDGKQFHENQSQHDFILSEAYFCGYVGGRGAGKSSSGSQKVLAKLDAGEPGIIINPDFENLKISTWPEFREWIPWDRVVQSQRYRRHPEWTPAGPFTLVFDNGAWVIIKGLKDPESARGPNVNWLWYDEGGRDRDGLAWKIAVASVRISRTGMPTQRILTTTPNWQAPWIKETFYDKKIAPDALEAFEGLDRPIIESFFGSLLDNRQNLDPATYATLLASYPAGYLREQEIMGKFVTPSGVLGNVAWFDNRKLDKAPEGVDARIRFWDLAGSAKKLTGVKKSLDPDSNVGTLFSKWGANFCIEEQIVVRQMPWEDFKKLVASTAERDGPYVPIWFEQEPGAGGVNQVEEFKVFIRDNVGPQWTVNGKKPEGDKIVRALPWFAEAERGIFYYVEGSWNATFFEQLGNFPEGAHDDCVDSVSGARHIIAPFKTWKRIEFLSLNSKITEPPVKEQTNNDIIKL
jgi:predicted phage terminase large subunit-like protein